MAHLSMPVELVDFCTENDFGWRHALFGEGRPVALRVQILRRNVHVVARPLPVNAPMGTPTPAQGLHRLDLKVAIEHYIQLPAMPIKS